MGWLALITIHISLFLTLCCTDQINHFIVSKQLDIHLNYGLIGVLCGIQLLVIKKPSLTLLLK